jgi:hypothetical protein
MKSFITSAPGSLFSFRHRLRLVRMFGRTDGRQRLDDHSNVLRFPGGRRFVGILQHHGRVVVVVQAGWNFKAGRLVASLYLLN